MVDQRYRFVVESVFQPGNAAQAASGTVDEIRRIFERVANMPLNLQTGQLAANLERDMRAAIQRAMSTDVRNSPLFQSMRQADQRAVSGTTATDPSRFLAEQLRLQQAEAQRAIVQAKSRSLLGSDKGYATETARTQAQVAAARGVEQANRALATAQQRWAAQILRDVQQQAAGVRREEEARARATIALNRRAAADERRAQADAAVPAPVSFAGADPRTPVGRSQIGVNNAERALQIANEQLATARTAENRTAASVIAAERRVEASAAALAGAQERLAQQEARSGRGAGFGSQFAQGFRGQSERPYGEQLGQAFKFSLFYGTAYKLLFAFTQTLSQTVQEGIEFQQAVTELKLATGQSVDNAKELAGTLGDQAVAAGLAPSQGVEAGARAIGLYGAASGSGASVGEQNRIAELSARVATRMAFSSGMALEDVQTRLAAVTNAFDLGFEGQLRVADLDAFFSKRFGTPTGATVRTVAEAGTVGKAAGYDLEEVNAIAALLMGRTGQSDSAVAGFMAQIFSRGGEGALSTVAGRYGIDPQLELADQIKALAEIYKKASPNQQTEIAASFGRGKVQNAAVVLLKNYDDVLSGAEAARTDATGAAGRSTDLRLGNLGGQIQILVGILKEFANQLGQSGLLDVVGLGVIVFRELVETGTQLLKIWNALPAPMRDAAIAIAALALASRAGAIAGAGGAAARLLPGAAFAGGQLGGLIAGGAGATVGAALLPVAAIAVAVAGLYAIGKLKESSDAMEDAQRQATEALSTGLGAGATSDQLAARSQGLIEQAKTARDAGGGIFAQIPGLGSEADRTRALSDQLKAEGERLKTVAEAQAAAEAAVDPNSQLSTSFDADSLSKAMETITTAGGSAQSRLDSLADSIEGLAGAARRATESFDPALFAGTNADEVFRRIQGSGSLLKNTPSLGDLAQKFTGLGTLYDDSDWKNAFPDLIQDVLSQGDVQKRLQNAVSGITSLADVSPEKLAEIAETVTSGIAQDALSGEDLPQGEIDKAQALILGAVTDFLTEQQKSLLEVVNGTRQYTGAELTAIMNQLAADAQSALAALPESNYGGRADVLRQAIRTARAAIANGPQGADISGPLEQLAALRQALAEQKFTELEQLRIAAQQDANSKAQVAKVGRAFLGKEIRAAVRNDRGDVLLGIIAQAGEGSVDIARKTVADALRTAQMALRVQRAIVAAARAMSAALSAFGLGSGTVGGADRSEVDRLKGLQDILQNPITGGGKDGNVYATGSDVPGYDSGGGAGADTATAAQRRAALAQARAVRNEGAIAAARADLQAARADMAAAKKGTTEYYAALSAYYGARNALTDAILEYRNNKYLLGIDITDPVAQATAALKAAQAKLRSDKGKGPDVIAADKVALRESEAAAEAARFSDRLSQVQTAEELGRISHKRYLSYLDNEHDRLRSISNRTHQQQEQLDEIDRLMKTAADSMDAQWNFGDIKLPTPYEVRRRTEELFPDRRQGQITAESFANPRAERGGDRTYIQIDGADTGKVLQIINQRLGQPGRTAPPSSRHR